MTLFGALIFFLYTCLFWKKKEIVALEQNSPQKVTTTHEDLSLSEFYVGVRF